MIGFVLCYLRLKCGVPCPTCSGVAFCSSACQTKSLTYHVWECPFMELMIGSGMSVVSHLSLRMVTQSKLQYFETFISGLKKPGTDHPYLKVRVLKL